MRYFYFEKIFSLLKKKKINAFVINFSINVGQFIASLKVLSKGKVAKFFLYNYYRVNHHGHRLNIKVSKN